VGIVGWPLLSYLLVTRSVPALGPPLNETPESSTGIVIEVTPSGLRIRVA
jgi:hypothetical protein